MAVSAAAAKILLLAALAEACCCAELYTFSNTRGTASRKVGLVCGRALATLEESGQCMRMAPDSRQPTSMILANECASGRNSNVELSGMSKISNKAPWTALRAAHRRLRWVSSQPFGRPVVPEV